MPQELICKSNKNLLQFSLKIMRPTFPSTQTLIPHRDSSISQIDNIWLHINIAYFWFASYLLPVVLFLPPFPLQKRSIYCPKEFTSSPRMHRGSLTGGNLTERNTRCPPGKAVLEKLNSWRWNFSSSTHLHSLHYHEKKIKRKQLSSPVDFRFFFCLSLSRLNTLSYTLAVSLRSSVVYL